MLAIFKPFSAESGRTCGFLPEAPPTLSTASTMAEVAVSIGPVLAGQVRRLWLYCHKPAPNALSLSAVVNSTPLRSSALQA